MLTGHTGWAMGLATARGQRRLRAKAKGSVAMTRLVHVELDDTGLPPPSAEVERERKVALFDLIEENAFALATREGKET
ncbi:MAG: UPF0262 family protein, partial [Pseudomonadota bacterium]